MTGKIEKLTEIIVKNDFRNIIELRKYVMKNSKEIGIKTKKMNEIISRNVDYFSLYFETKQ